MFEISVYYSVLFCLLIVGFQFVVRCPPRSRPLALNVPAAWRSWGTTARRLGCH